MSVEKKGLASGELPLAALFFGRGSTAALLAVHLQE
jgi:hypothetical protein